MRYEIPSGAGAVRLHLNENNAGCSPRVIDALRSITPAEIATYPDYAAITARVAQWFGVEPDRVQLVNGLDEGLHLATAAAALGSPGGSRTFRSGDPLTALYPAPAFDMYRVCAEEVGLNVEAIPPSPDFAFPLEEVIAASERAAIVYLTDPNNPTGLGIPDGAVETIAASAPQSMVMVDEAYADFSGRTSIGPLLDRRRNVVVGRTFAKGHGLAGLRVGALVAHPDALAPIRDRVPPFTMNVAAVRALDAALDDEAWLRACLAESAVSKELIYAFCVARGLQYWRSEANFVLLRLGPDVPAIVSALAARGILIRDRSTQPGCDGCVRIGASTVDGTTRCLAALEDILATRDN